LLAVPHLRNVNHVCPWLVELVSSMPAQEAAVRNVNRVCPWLVELVSSMPAQEAAHTAVHGVPLGVRATFRPRLPAQPPSATGTTPPGHPASNHDRNRHGFVPPFPFPDSIAAAAGILQGARHPQFASFFSDLHLSILQQSLLFCGIPGDHQAPPTPRITTDTRAPLSVT